MNKGIVNVFEKHDCINNIKDKLSNMAKLKTNED
jgi:hypothetical protein